MNKNKQYINTEILKCENINKDFTRCHISVCSYNQIANRTKFTKDGIEKAVSTLGYAPVIGYWIGDDFYDHGNEVLINDCGEIESKSYTVPYGVVIKDTARWEYIQKQNGEYEEYLCVDVYLWNRYQDQINKVKENECNQSMEITIDSGEYKENYFEIHEFSFDALCILSKNIDPAFVQAKIRTIDTNFAKSEQFTGKYREMIDALTKYISEGDESMEKVDLNAIAEENVEDSAVEPVIEEPIKEENEEVVEPVVEEEATEPVVEEPVVEEEVPTENFEEKYNTLNGEYADLQAKNVELETQYNALMEEVLQLREYKLNAEKKIREEQETNIFSKFEEISDTKEFKELKNNSANYSLEELEDKAFAIYGRLNKDKASKSTKKDKKVDKEETIIYNTVDSTNFEEHKITNSFSELVNKYKNK